ncbi:MAG: DUF424 family protein [Nanoarchaeota archaeon]|nr:DUF424 family protein [Nanoarchaeota archaeon]
MIVKAHKTPDGRVMLAICDNELIGKKFEERNLQLDLTSNFYKGEEKNEEEIRLLLKEAHIVNVVGEKSIVFLIKEGIVNKDNIIRVQDIPHAQAITG